MITGSPSLSMLDVGRNNIGDDGISLCFNHITTVTNLMMQDCGLSIKGTVVLYEIHKV